MKNILRATIGFVMLALGAIGLVVPLLPTTPFVLLAAACFAPIPTLHRRVMRIPFVNEYVSNYRDRKGISRKTLVTSLTSLWLMLAISAVILRRPWVILCLGAVGTAVTTHLIIVSRPKSPEKPKNEQNIHL